MTESSMRTRFLIREVDERRGDRDLELMSVSMTRGVVPRSDLTDDEPRADDLSNYKVCRAGDLVVNRMSAYQGALGLAQQDGIVSPDYIVFRLWDEVAPRWLHHVMRSSWFVSEMAARIRGIGSIGTGNVRTPRVSAEEIGEIRIAVPDREHQQTIADYLDAETARIDALIAKKQRMIELLDEHRSELRREAVESLVDSGVPLSQFRRMVRKTHAGEVIDQSWWGDGQETLFTCAREPVRSSFEIFPADRRTTGDEILLTRNGTPYVHLPPPGAIYTNVVQRVVLDHRLDRVFASVALDVASRQMHRQGVSIDSLNFTMWKELRIPVPSLELQQALMKRLGEAESRHRRNVDLHERQIALLLERRQALITAAVTGELEVPGVAA